MPSAARLDDFVALNTELAALTRAGLPLELGLGSGGTGRLQHLGDRVSDRLRRGIPLEQAIADETELPTAYRAVVMAGLQSNRLAEAVESVGRTAAARADLQRRMNLGAIYPTILLAVGFVVLTTAVPVLLSLVLGVQVDFRLRVDPRLVALDRWLSGSPLGWKYWLPVLTIGLLWLCGGLGGLAARLPGMRAIVRAHQLATFAELAGSLLEHGVPMHTAFGLAGDACGHSALAAEAHAAADQFAAGISPEQALRDIRSIPAFPRWMLTTGAAQGTLPASLALVAQWAARRAEVKSDWFRLVAPIAVTVVVGTLIVGLCAAALFAPVLDLLHGLAREPMR